MERNSRNTDAFGTQNMNIDVSNGGDERQAGFAAVDMGDSDRIPKEVLGERPKRQEADPEIAPVAMMHPGDEEGDEDYDDEDEDNGLIDDDEPDTDAAAIADDDIDIDADDDFDDEDLDDDALLDEDDDEDEDDEIR